MRKLRAINAPTTPPSALLSNLAEGLHAMAQPLTILRGALSAAGLRGTVAPEDQRYIAMSSAQVERLCDLLCKLRALLDVEQFPPSFTTFDLLELAGRAIGDSETVQHENGVRITPPPKNSVALVLADSGRTEQAVCTALSTVIALSSPGDELQCRVDVDASLARLVVQNGHRQGRNLSSADHLALSLIEASLASQRGTCVFTEKPLCLSITLPLAQAAQGTGYITSDCVNAAV